MGSECRAPLLKTVFNLSLFSSTLTPVGTQSQFSLNSSTYAQLSNCPVCCLNHVVKQKHSVKNMMMITSYADSKNVRLFMRFHSKQLNNSWKIPEIIKINPKILDDFLQRFSEISRTSIVHIFRRRSLNFPTVINAAHNI